ncbi:hypothetical protein AHAS_Ahas11G0341400 [Arachis hypogaea]
MDSIFLTEDSNPSAAPSEAGDAAIEPRPRLQFNLVVGFYEIAPCIELKTAPADFRFPTTNQTRHCFTRYVEFHRWQQRVMIQLNVRDLLNITAPFALENGLKSGMSRGRMGLSQDLFEIMSVPWTTF